VAAALAQIGEFSFILATLGLSLGLIPDDAYQLVVAGSLVSISLNPFVFRLVGPVEARLLRRPGLLAALERRPARLAVLPPADVAALGNHAVLCGYGRVGRLVAAALQRRGFRYVVISDDRREVDRLRQAGVPALYGDAANEDLLREARIDAAKVLIVALADGQAARLVVDRVRAQAARVPIVVRTHSGTEAVHLRSLGSTVQPVHAEREVAIQITRFSLRRFGVSAAEVDAIAGGLRDRDPGGDGGPPPPGGRSMVGRLRDLLRSRTGRAADAMTDPDAPRRGPGVDVLEISPEAAPDR
jgi:CPA2 family monovalent cation:H+ antiporter-2